MTKPRWEAGRTRWNGRRDRTRGGQLPRILCIGVDITWWGGSRQPASRWETIVSAILADPMLHAIQRISLTEYPNPCASHSTEPNFDGDGMALCTAILATIARHSNLDQVIIASMRRSCAASEPTNRRAAGR